MIAIIRLIIGNPWFLVAAAIALAASLGFAKGWTMEHDARIAAMATQDIAWRQAIEKANHDAENDANARVQAALEAAAAVLPAPADGAALAKLCSTDAACRDRQQGPKPSMPGSQANNLVHR